MPKFFPQFATVYTEDGYHKVMLPNGVVIPGLTKTVTECGIDFSEVTFTFTCNRVSTKKEALELYHAYMEQSKAKDKE